MNPEMPWEEKIPEIPEEPLKEMKSGTQEEQN